jgi:hypothetical protein
MNMRWFTQEAAMTEKTVHPAIGEAPEASLSRAMDDAISEASRQYEIYLKLATVAQLAASTREELRSYRRNWSHPLGLVMNASVESTSR